MKTQSDVWLLLFLTLLSESQFSLRLNLLISEMYIEIPCQFHKIVRLNSLDT